MDRQDTSNFANCHASNHADRLAHAPLPAKLLQRPVDNVAAQAIALVAAMDAVLSGF